MSNLESIQADNDIFDKIERHNAERKMIAEQIGLHYEGESTEGESIFSGTELQMEEFINS